MEVRQKVVRVRLGQIRPIEVEAEEHEHGPYHDPVIYLPDEPLYGTGAR